MPYSYHKVKSTDSIGNIAAQYGTTPNLLLNANPDIGSLSTGISLRIPPPPAPTTTPSLSGVSGNSGTGTNVAGFVPYITNRVNDTKNYLTAAGISTGIIPGRMGANFTPNPAIVPRGTFGQQPSLTPKKAGTTNPFEPSTSSGAGSSGLRPGESEDIGSVAGMFAQGQFPQTVGSYDAQKLGYTPQELAQAGYRFDYQTNTFNYTGKGSQAAANEQGVVLPSGERGDVFSRGGASQYVATQSQDGNITAAYQRTSYGGRPANYGKKGQHWKTYVSGGIKITAPDYGRGWRKRNSEAGRARRSARYQQRASQTEQAAGYGLIDSLNFRVATG